MPDEENRRITVALLGAKIDALILKVDAAMMDAKVDRKAMVELSTRVTRLEERMSLWAAGLASFTLIAAAIAGWLGVRS
jgi:hypothetical protein